MALYKTHEDYKFPNKFRQPAKVCRKKYEKKCCPQLDTYLSGSPIVQNGHIIGAVTHVFISDSKMGYGIFIENMLEH
ncbi:MAG: hypothetical protein HFH29_06555 [Eubacterium sp.]|nr:hypothetical protein [Eubacterium sp.]